MGLLNNDWVAIFLVLSLVLHTFCGFFFSRLKWQFSELFRRFLVKISVIENAIIWKYLTILAKSVQIYITDLCFLKLLKIFFNTLKNVLTGALFFRFCRSYNFFLFNILARYAYSHRFSARAVVTLKQLGGPRSWKNVGRHGWPTEKILVFELPKTAQMALKFLCFFRNIFKYVQEFPCLSKHFL